MNYLYTIGSTHTIEICELNYVVYMCTYLSVLANFIVMLSQYIIIFIFKHVIWKNVITLSYGLSGNSFFFFGIWKFLGQGLTLRHSYNLCHSCSSIRFFNPLFWARN